MTEKTRANLMLKRIELSKFRESLRESRIINTSSNTFINLNEFESTRVEFINVINTNIEMLDELLGLSKIKQS